MIEDEFFTGFVKPYEDKKYAFMALLPKKAECASFLLRAMKQINFANLQDYTITQSSFSRIWHNSRLKTTWNAPIKI